MNDLEIRRRQAGNGICPYCDRGPYEAVVVHAAAAHGIHKDTFREALQLAYGAVLTSPDFHQRRVARSRAEYYKPTSAIRANLVTQKGFRKRRSVPDRAHTAEQQHLISARLDAARQVLVARWLSGISVQQLSDEYGVLPATIYRRLQTARDKMGEGGLTLKEWTTQHKETP